MHTDTVAMEQDHKASFLFNPEQINFLFGRILTQIWMNTLGCKTQLQVKFFMQCKTILKVTYVTSCTSTLEIFICQRM